MDARPIACLIYDFDKTLSPNNMQEYGFLKGLHIEPGAFWAECREFAIENRMDGVLAYMYKMMEKAQGVMELSRDVFRRLGGGIEFFPGVRDWFGRINAYGDSLGLTVEHYIVSSGLTEIIEGTAIAPAFREIFAASYCYDASGRPLWPSSAVNYTNKTQFIFRINKGILDVTNDVDLNSFTPEDRRRVPYRNMIYVGDGLTDVPSMKLTRSKGGFSIAVHPPGETAAVDDMLLQNRVDFALTADYSAGSELERVVQAVLRQIVAVDECARLHASHLDAARRHIDARKARPVTYEGKWIGERE
ncbi:MAG: haloacid dehalogenase-like hydrolase [Clostridia bacterium]|nr:haloacid dehalogenase-like hydrolase [Clostridia bacterium]